MLSGEINLEMGLSESIGKTNMDEDMAEAQACFRDNWVYSELWLNWA